MNMPWDDSLDAGTSAYAIAASDNSRIHVVTGPGAGKSFAMKRRVVHLLELEIEPTQILPVTFTRVAAEDLYRELVGMVVSGCEEIEGVALHSLAMRILMRQHVRVSTVQIAAGWRLRRFTQVKVIVDSTFFI
jgi:DNA helicase II / ATP-dependent DNA helicase PcrA